MKKTLSIISMAVILAACASQKEVLQPEVPPKPVVRHIPEKRPEPPRHYRSVISCEENTESFFNRSGIEVMPFVRLTFFDMDNDGKQELVAGGKDGALRLYKRGEKDRRQKWEQVGNYFAGITVGAFSSPAVADVDRDGRPEVVVGTGGFSSESGRVLVFKNRGSLAKPMWERVDIPFIDVGDDATPALVDINGDALPDIVVGNSTGALFLYRNISGNGKIAFTRDADCFKGINVGMYGMPSATVHRGRVVIIAGNSMGKLQLIERQQSSNSSWQKTALRISFPSFAAPAFMQDRDDPAADLVVSDGNGQIHYYRNSKTDFREWEEVSTFFAGRVMPGPACAPSMAELEKKTVMITGNINGELKLYEYRAHSEVLPWVEKPLFFRGIKLSGFARGSLAAWQGKKLLVTGQQDGFVRAFLNTGTDENPAWKEQKDFFQGVPKIMHASPAVFDLDGDGSWELVVGDVEGVVTAYRLESAREAKPYWKKIEHVFTGVKVARYASPALAEDADRLYLFVGQQNGSMIAYSARKTASGSMRFMPEDMLGTIHVGNHSSPSVLMKNGVFEMSVGDYNGNLRHYACRAKDVEVSNP